MSAGFPEPDENGQYRADDLMAWLAADRAERYAALHAAFGDDIDAMLMFPWSPPVVEEQPMSGGLASFGPRPNHGRCDAQLSDDCRGYSTDLRGDGWPRKYVNGYLMWATCLECTPQVTSLHEFSQRVERGQW